MEWNIFLGRFHPLIVHLPIGIIIISFLFEWLYFLGVKRLANSRKIITIGYSFGLLSGAMASFAGYLLSFHDVYGIKALNLHMNLAIICMISLTILLIIQWKVSESRKAVKIMASTITVILISLTGHFGGNLTHGPGYLFEYGPKFLQKKNDVFENLNQDSLLIYNSFIKPVLDEKCMACHEKNNYKGGLALDEYKNLFKEADSGVPIYPGHPLESEIFSRVSLSTDNEKYMPPRGQGLSFIDIEILKYWIQNGADSTTQFDSEQMSPELIELVNRNYNLDYSPKPYLEKVEIDSIEESILDNIRNSGFRVNYISDESFLLDVDFLLDTFQSRHIDLLNEIADHITFLDLSGANINDKMLKQLDGMEHLTRLNLKRNELSESIPSFVKNSAHLESVNLNETNIVTESLVEILRELELQRLYIMNTGIIDDQITPLINQFPDVEFISKFKFSDVEKPKSVFEKQAPE